MEDPGVYDHLRPVDADDVPPGIYRVVGTGGREGSAADVAVLRVADGDGTRRHTGELRRVPRSALDGFEPAPNPDGNRPLAVRLVGAAGDLVWQCRAFGRSLARRPVPAAVALSLVAAGVAGERLLPFPESVLTGMTVVGALALVALARPRGR